MVDHVLGTFTRLDTAQDVRARLAARFGDRVRIGDVDDELDALALGQRAEMDESMPLMSAGVFSGPFARGALIWGLVGIVVGAVVSWPVALMVESSVPRWVLAIAFAFAGALAASSVTFLLGAGRQAVKEGETTPEDPRAIVRVDVPRDQSEAVVQSLADAGARRIHVIDGPVPRPPTSEVERPRAPVQDPAARTVETEESDAGFHPDRT